MVLTLFIADKYHFYCLKWERRIGEIILGLCMSLVREAAIKLFIGLLEWFRDLEISVNAYLFDPWSTERQDCGLLFVILSTLRFGGKGEADKMRQEIKE